MLRGGFMLVLSFTFLVLSIVFGILWIIKRKKNPIVFKVLTPVSFLLGVGCFLAEIGEIEEIVLIISFLLFIFSVILLITGLKKNKKEKNGKMFLIFSAVSAIVALLVLPLISIGNLQQMFFSWTLAVFAVFVCLLISLIVNKIKKRHIKKNLIALAVSACLFIGLFALSSVIADRQIKKAYENHEIAEEKIQIDYDFKVEDGTEPVKIKDYYQNSIGNTYVYDSEHLYLLYGKKGATLNDCLDAINNNPGISQKFKSYFCDFTKRISEKYPEASLDILCYNLKTLKVEELSKFIYVTKSWNSTSLGCYSKPDNSIFIPEGTKYIEGEFGFQVLIHEFCHAARCCWLDGSLNNCALFNSEQDTGLLEECLNTVFSCSLLNYYEWDIAYQVPSNYLRIMLECMDNYNLSDYMNYSDAFFLKKLDESTGYTNYAGVMWKLITLQRHDWESDKIDIPEKEYAPIIDYLCEMYYKKYITADMSADEAKKVADELVYKASYDAPEGFKIDTQRYYDNMVKYINTR